MRAAADAGLEWARDTINGTPGILPLAGNQVLQNAQPVRDASGAVIPGYSRSVFVGRSGSTTGQFGVFASVISRIDDNAGRAVVVRRSELAQESFSQFARFDDVTNPGIVFANGIQVFGPIHTNGILQVGSAGAPAVFHGPATTSATINAVANGTFMAGYKTGVPTINLPTPANLATLSGYATTGNLVVAGGAVGTTVYNPQTRIEFVAVDVNNDGDFTDENEGFIRVYRGNSPTTANILNYVTARQWNTGSATDPNLTSPNCGDQPAGQPFLPAVSHIAGGPAGHNHSGVLATNQRASLTAATRRCYLGGDSRLTPTPNVFTAATVVPTYGALGGWVKWPGYGAGNAPASLLNHAIHSNAGVGLTTGNVVGGITDYLWPINRSYNPNFMGVIYVNGSVGVSGVVRGQVTLAATGNVLLADDLTYVTAPGSIPDCDRNGGVFADMLGLLTPQFLIIEDNNVNSPFEVNGNFMSGHDDSADETLQGAVLTLNSVLSEDVGNGADGTEAGVNQQCAGSFIGRGCFNMVGAAIQGVNAARMSGSGGGATGWNPQWTYDRCDGLKPPPYFPTTGRYSKNRYYEIDPVGFNVNAWFIANQ